MRYSTQLSIIPSRHVTPCGGLIGLLCSLLVVTLSRSVLAAPGAPNVLVILADDLGFSDLGCYGGEIATPTLDRLAQDGLRFTQFYNTGRCWPTRAALLTGYYAQQVRRDQVEGIPSGGAGKRPVWAHLVPARLRPLGYRTYHSGKWHVDGPRLGGGFDRSFSVEDHDRFFYPQKLLVDDKPVSPLAKQTTDFYLTTAIADHAIMCLQEHAVSHAAQPFFHYLCFTSPHFPLQAPAADVARYADRYAVGWSRLRAERFQRQLAGGLLHCRLSDVEPEIGPPYHFAAALETLGPSEVNRPLPWDELSRDQQVFQAAKMAVHAAMVDRMDREIGRVFDQVRKMQQWENTLIFFLSDNGASAEIMVRGDGHQSDAPAGSAATFLCLGPGWSNAANTPFRRHKTWVHEGGIATPLIVHWPKGIRDPGQLRADPGHVIDLVPTILAAASSAVADPSLLRSPDTVAALDASIANIPPLPGESLLGRITSADTGEDRTLWWLHEGHRALRQGRWKLVAAKGDPWELYDMVVDRSETDNLADRHPQRVVEMAAIWQARYEAYAAVARAK